MAPRPEPLRPLDAHGSLRIDTPSGRSLNLVAQGEMLRLELPGWGDARRVFPVSLRGRIRAVRSIAGLLSAHGLTLSLESAGHLVARLGHNTSANWLARLLGLGPVNLPVSNIRRLFRNQS
jgi:hypothetical protein